jgi:hypothetical protein
MNEIAIAEELVRRLERRVSVAARIERIVGFIRRQPFWFFWVGAVLLVIGDATNGGAGTPGGLLVAAWVGARLGLPLTQRWVRQMHGRLADARGAHSHAVEQEEAWRRHDSSSEHQESLRQQSVAQVHSALDELFARAGQQEHRDAEPAGVE